MPAVSARLGPDEPGPAPRSAITWGRNRAGMPISTAIRRALSGTSPSIWARAIIARMA
jgi:hypothetical protein